jgi:hypothetical protein
VRQGLSNLVSAMEAAPVDENGDWTFWDRFEAVGLTGELLRLEHDQMASHAESGVVEKTLHVVNVFLESLRVAVIAPHTGVVHATRKLKGFIEPFFHRILEPNLKIQTLF